MIENHPEVVSRFIEPFSPAKMRAVVRANGKDLMVSWGMAESGYDITLLEDVTLYGCYSVLGVTQERVGMPTNMASRVIGKSTWARLGVHLNVTEIDPGFNGHVTLELSYLPRWRGLLRHWRSALYPETLKIPAKTGIGCLQFVHVSHPSTYSGKYEGQGAKPVEAR